MSDCGVCIGSRYDSYSGNDFDCGPHTSNEDEKCCECESVIPAGTKYESAHWLDDDEKPQSADTCDLCAEIAWAFSCEARVYFNLWEDIGECVFPEFSVSCLEKLTTPEAKAELQRRWMQWKGLAA